MKKIVFAVIIVFVFVVPIFAGENKDAGQTEKQIIVAKADAACKRECDIDKNTCMSDCSRHSGSYKSRNDTDNYERASCKHDCMQAYDSCIKGCY